MNMQWWLDGFLLFALVLFLIAMYQLSKRSMAAIGGINFNDAQWLEGMAKKSRFFPAKTIRYAGFNPERLFATYWIMKGLLLILGPLALLEFADFTVTIWHLLACSLVSFLLIDSGFWYLARNRKIKVQRSVSYFSDLLVAFLKSGQSLPQAFSRAASHGLPKSQPLTSEVQLVASEMEMGLSWQSAFDKLAQRTGVKDLQRIAMIMQVGYKTGVPVITSLARHADLLREKQKEAVNEMLNRKSIEALIPTLLLSMPMFIVLVFFPTGVQIYEAFQMFTSSW